MKSEHFLLNFECIANEILSDMANWVNTELNTTMKSWFNTPITQSIILSSNCKHVAMTYLVQLDDNNDNNLRPSMWYALTCFLVAYINDQKVSRMSSDNSFLSPQNEDVAWANSLYVNKWILYLQWPAYEYKGNLPFFMRLAYGCQPTIIGDIYWNGPRRF